MIHGLEEELEKARNVRDGKIDMPKDFADLHNFRDPDAPAPAAPAPAAPAPAALAPFVCSECKVESAARKLTCARCKRAHYCSKGCQTRAWRDGHRRVCKPAVAFAEGQRCVLKGLEATPELNGKVVVVLGPSSAAGGERWRVRVADTRAVISVRPGVLMSFWSPAERPDTRPPRLTPEAALGKLSAYMGTFPDEDTPEVAKRRAEAAARKAARDANPH